MLPNERRAQRLEGWRPAYRIFVQHSASEHVQKKFKGTHSSNEHKTDRWKKHSNAIWMWFLEQYFEHIDSHKPEPLKPVANLARLTHRGVQQSTLQTRRQNNKIMQNGTGMQY